MIVFVLPIDVNRIKRAEYYNNNDIRYVVIVDVFSVMSCDNASSEILAAHKRIRV